MASSLAKLGPMAAVAALTGYCLMPFLVPSAPLPSKSRPEPPPRIDSSMLEPRLEPPLERNPFEATRPVVSAGGTGGSPGKSVATTSTAPDQPHLPEGLFLGATLVHGNRRAAVINDRVYSEGESVPVPTAGTEDSARTLVLGRVEHDRVWLNIAWKGKAVPVALAYVPRSPVAKAPIDSAATAAGEPGSLEHLQALTANPQYNALMVLAQSLLGRGLVPTSDAGSPGALPTLSALTQPAGAVTATQHGLHVTRNGSRAAPKPVSQRSPASPRPTTRSIARTAR